MRTPTSEVSLEVRFWSRVAPFDHRTDKECAEWLGHCLPTNYGVVYDGERPQYAHRVSWELTNGTKVPDGMVVHHRCNNPRCVRPAHLMLATYAENLAAAKEANRTRVLPELTTADVRAIRHAYKTGRWSQGDLAEMFYGTGAGQPHINRIVQGKTYPNAGGPITKRGRGNKAKRRRNG